MRWLAVLALCSLPALAHALDIRVQSGEHDGFTRLAILFGDVPDWELGRVSGGYELRPAQPDARYGLAGVYPRIGRERIVAVEDRGDGRLFLAVDCTCHADLFDVPRAVVIDIRDGPPPEDTGFETTLVEGTPGGAETTGTVADSVTPSPPSTASSPPGPAGERSIGVDLGPMRTDVFRSPLAWQHEIALDLTPPPVPAPTPPDPEPRPVPTPLPILAEGRTPDPDAIDAETRARLAQMQADLLAQLGRAASQGMIEADPARFGAALNGSDPAPTPGETGLEVLRSLDNVTVETAVDRGQVAPPPRQMTRDGNRCIPDDRLDVSAWGEPVTDGAAIWTRRGDIVGEFDAASPEAVASLARHYLYLSFGAEARALLSSFEPSVADAPLYHALAEIMDHGQARTRAPFAGQESCPSRAALWGVLAQDPLRDPGAIATRSVVAAFSELPIHLRRHLGPWLVERFIAAGDAGTATLLRNAIVRAPGDAGEGLDLIDAEIALDAGKTEAGAAHLETVVEGNGAMAADALVRLIDTRLAAGKSVATKDRDHAAALAFEHRNTPVGAELKRVHIRALARGGDPEGALAELAANENVLTSETTEDLTVEIFGLIADETPQDMFLRLVLPGPVHLGPTPEADEVRRDIATRLIGLGLTEPARMLMSDDPSLPTEADRLLYARAYLKERRPDLMIGYLAGLDSPESKALVARAHELAEEYARAADAYAEIEDEDAQTRALWRGQDWSGVAPLVTGVERDAAALVAGLDLPSDGTPLPDEELPPPPEPGSLAESRAILADSQKAREILEALLQSSALFAE